MGRIVLIAFVVVASVLGLAARFLPWWGVLLLLVGLVAIARFAGGALLKRFAMGLFGSKSAVLEGAALEVRSVASVAAPPAEDYWDEEEKREAAAQRYFAVEVTITPRAGAGALGHWEPGELVFAKPGKRFDDEDAEAGDLRRVEVLRDGSFGEDEECKYQGAQTLRLTVGVPERVAKATLRYYFEDLGTVDFGARRSS